MAPACHLRIDRSALPRAGCRLSMAARDPQRDHQSFAADSVSSRTGAGCSRESADRPARSRRARPVVAAARRRSRARRERCQATLKSGCALTGPRHAEAGNTAPLTRTTKRLGTAGRSRRDRERSTRHRLEAHHRAAREVGASSRASSENSRRSMARWPELGRSLAGHRRPSRRHTPQDQLTRPSRPGWRSRASVALACRRPARRPASTGLAVFHFAGFRSALRTAGPCSWRRCAPRAAQCV